MYFSVLVKWGGVCWGLGCVWVIGRAMVFFFFGGSKVLLKLSTFWRLKSKSKNSKKKTIFLTCDFLKKKSCEIFLLENFPIFFQKFFQKMSSKL